MIDTYEGLEVECNRYIKAGTEELNFYSETNTYNRDNKPCIEFSALKDFISGIDYILHILK